MSRKRDTNWNRDEITVLLDSILEITRLRVEDGKRTNSREVFEFAAKRLGEKGFVNRAEREKCRTKWKKMKEEFNHAKKAREGDARYKEAPGIQPFYDRMEIFINGNYDNISPHSTIVRRSSSISSSNNTTVTNATSASSTSASSSGNKSLPVSRASARLAASNGIATPGLANMEPDDLSSTTTTSNNTTALNVAANGQTQHQQQTLTSNSSKSNQQPTLTRQATSRLSSGSDSNSNMTQSSSNNNGIANNNIFPPASVTNNNANTNESTDRSRSASNLPDAQSIQPHSYQQTNGQSRLPNEYPQLAHHLMQHPDQQAPLGEVFVPHNGTSTNHSNNTNNQAQNPTPSPSAANSHHNVIGCLNSSMHNNHQDTATSLPTSNHIQPAPSLLAAEQADISYRVSSGYRQITIFGDHDVDIKFRGDCVTINKISNDYNNCIPFGSTSGFKALGNNNNNLGSSMSSTNTTRDMEDEDCR